MLKVLGDGGMYRLKEVAAKCADALKISEEDRKTLLPSKRQTILANRVAWAKTYLKKAGLVDSPQHGFVVLTEAGKSVLADDPDKVTIAYLETIPSFHESHAMPNAGGTAGTAPPDSDFFNEDV
ncbi:MAG: winged helix-turn-helix domain-containing protein [Selenomonadaceae bacterium]|uniref:winged helix-turn-helix domain-containing protein n=1 Tax=Selenomonas sp. TaxID=2053611 RepID=UPI0025F925ED|nr:winged helix-turn-helix domain-containing protein [Selenomonas sp.]MDY6268228.1 winged helix-turn-helix domain-containing protein [Selenomonadaceae bacterium]